MARALPAPVLRRPRRHSLVTCRERGSVTAETAVLLPALAVVVALSLGALAAVGTQLRCIDASRTGARALARGETPQAALAAARSTAPKGAVLELTRNGKLAIVHVHVQARPFGVLGRAAGTLHIRSRAVAAVEE